jgi:hypothetical protein
MEINVGEVSTSIHAMDSEQLLSPRLMERIVAEVVRAVDERHEHRERVKQERRTMAGAEDWESGGNY